MTSVILLLSSLLAGADALTQPAAGNEPRAIASAVLDQLDAAWNKGDGAAFANQFTADATLVNIFGEQYAGRPEITKRMQLIFSTIFKGSVHRTRTLESAIALAPGVIMSVSSALVDVPSGPQAPRMHNRQTAILVREGSQWKIRHWHNTLIREAK